MIFGVFFTVKLPALLIVRLIIETSIDFWLVYTLASAEIIEKKKCREKSLRNAHDDKIDIRGLGLLCHVKVVKMRLKIIHFVCFYPMYRFVVRYVNTTGKNMDNWLDNMIETESQDWYQSKLPETDSEGFFQTTLPIILFQMLDQNLQVGQFIKKRVRLKILGLSKLHLYCFQFPLC